MVSAGAWRSAVRRAAVCGLWAALLAADPTVLNYDRRGRGSSGDTPPYAVAREVEDIEALIDAAGGKAALFGSSSGAVLALVGVVITQEPKQGGLGEGLGGGGQDFTASTGGTAGGLQRLTIYLGAIWGVLALALAIIPRA